MNQRLSHIQKRQPPKNFKIHNKINHISSLSFDTFHTWEQYDHNYTHYQLKIKKFQLKSPYQKKSTYQKKKRLPYKVF